MVCLIFILILLLGVEVELKTEIGGEVKTEIEKIEKIEEIEVEKGEIEVEKREIEVEI